MVPNLYNKKTWETIQAIITSMYLNQFYKITENKNSFIFREFKIVNDVRIRIISSGYYEVYWNGQTRTGHISDLIGYDIIDRNVLDQLPPFPLPDPSDQSEIYNPSIFKPFSNSTTPSPGTASNSSSSSNSPTLSSSSKYSLSSIIKNNDIIPPSDLKDLSIEDIIKYMYLMEKALINSYESKDLYLGNYDRIDLDNLIEKIKSKHSDVMNRLGKEVPEPYAEEALDENERGEIMSNTVNNTNNDNINNDNMNNIENNQVGWHAPVILYNPSYEKPNDVGASKPLFPKYAQDTLASIYNLIGRIPWVPNAPILLGSNARFNTEIAGEYFIHPSWLEVAKLPIRDKDYMLESFIPTLRRKLEFEKMVLNRKALEERHYPSNDLFNIFIEKRFEAALKLDSDSNIKRKTILKEVKALLKKQGFIHMHIHEDMIGSSVLAKNIMLTLHEEHADSLKKYQDTVKEYFNYILNHKNEADKAALILTKNPPEFTVKGYIDFNANTYPKHMGVEMTPYYSKIKNSPADLVYQIMKHNVDMLSNIIKNMPGDARLESNVYVINPIEWALDFIRYAIERIEYHTAAKELDQIFMRDLNKDPIYEPIPLRLAVNISVKYPADLEYQALPAQIIDTYELNNSSKDHLKKLLWDGKAFMNSVRDLPWRNQIAPQLWDTTFFCGTMVLKTDATGSISGPVYNNDVYGKANTENVFTSFDRLSKRIIAGKDAYPDSAKTLIARKMEGETHDELGYYLSFYNQSKMEGL